jgi:hypothetical protein
MTATLLFPSGERVAAQDLPTQPASPAAAEQTPAAQAAPAPAEFTAGAPHVHTVAQGLIGVDGPLVWRVREVGLSATGAPESAASSFTLQRTGAAIIRNELTSRRTRLEAGEGFFMPAGDPFLRYAVGSDPSIVWILELVPPEAVAAGVATTGTVLFTSDAINDFPRGTFDLELQRGILLPGEVSEVPPHTGPALMMVTSGRVQATADGGQPAPVNAGSGRLVTGALTLRNGDTQPAAFVVAALGEPVDGAEQPAAAAQVGPTPVPGQPVPTVLLPPVDAAPTAVAPTPVPVAVEPTPVPAPIESEALAVIPVTIRVIAEGDIQVTVVADDVVVFSGWLGAGGATDWYTAGLFAVTTTDGSLTLFENAATGQQFYMGYGANETFYLAG